MAAPKGRQHSGANAERLNSGAKEHANAISRRSHSSISVALKCKYSEIVDHHKP